ncbi:MAG TPA: BrnT family toxin [Steroidobacteraceae bacterium]|nr:BrnT family toxin [Steroidobacteraceae bacterium]
MDPMITWDEYKRLRNLADHGIDLEDLGGFFAGDLLTIEDVREPYGETRFQSLGLFAGVVLFVVWTPRGDDDVPHVISARKAVKHEKQAWYGRYERRSYGLGPPEGVT